MSDETGENGGDIVKKKKGVKNIENYKRNMIKTAKVKGLSHTNWRGKRVETKCDPLFMNKDCCKKGCLRRVNPPELLDDVMINFYNLSSKNEQDLHLQRMIEIHDVKRNCGNKNLDVSDQKPKFKTVKYYLLLKGKRFSVCKNAFLNAHNVSPKRIKRIANLLQNNAVPVDLRGKKSSANAIAPSVCRKIHTHIESFPTKESHYTSKVITYLSSELTVKQMHKMFLLKYPELDGTVNYQFYRNYFNQNFDLQFGQPAKDSCSKCEALNTRINDALLNDTAKRVAQAELDVHKRQSNKFYNSLKASAKLAKENPKVLAICFDFMAVLDLPKLPVQEIFYFRQLGINNFGIYNLANDRMVCYIYHEGTARKTPDDVCSFILHYLNNFVSNDTEELHLFCDNCAGQNKNHAMIRFLMCLSEQKRFKRIKLFFPIRGHSYLPCDRGFGLIKRKLNSFDRLYTIEEYIHKVIMTASDVPQKFTVFHVDSSLTLDFQNWFPKYYFKTKKSESSVQQKETEHFTISKYHQFEFRSKESNVLKTREYIGGLMKQYFRLRRGNVKDIELPKKNLSERVPILSSKMKDLKNLSMYIPEEHMNFWNGIYVWPTRE